MDIIQLKNIEKSYGSKIIFRDVNIGIKSGSFTVIKGESGAGKSTLLNLIGGLEVLTGGQIIVDNENISKLTAKQRVDFYRHKVGIIFQGLYLQP